MEHRNNQRTPLMIYLDVRDASNGEMLGHLGDISETGMMLITNLPIQLGTEYEICIDLPDTLPIQRETLRARIGTLWQKPNINPAQHCIGCHFIDFPDDEIPDLRILGDHLGFSMDIEIHRVSEK